MKELLIKLYKTSKHKEIFITDFDISSGLASHTSSLKKCRTVGRTADELWKFPRKFLHSLENFPEK